MLDKIPAPLSELVARLSQLPGMGPKSAMRVAMTFLHWPEEQTRSLGQCIATLRDKLHLCKRCGGLSASEICPLCADQQRRQDQLCLVSDWDSMLALDSGGFYNGQFFIVGSLLGIMDQASQEKLNLEPLLQRIAEGEVKELIYALGATIEAENTGNFISTVVQNRFGKEAPKISRLAQGIPLGSEVKHMDPETLRQALKYRQSLAE